MQKLHVPQTALHKVEMNFNYTMAGKTKQKSLL